MVILVMLAALAFLPLADRVVYAVWRRTRYERARRTAEYPLTDPTNWRQPSNNTAQR
jgi:hypothetical protein